MNPIHNNRKIQNLAPLQAAQVLKQLNLPNPQEAAKTQNLFSKLKDVLFGSTASTSLSFTRLDKYTGKQQQVKVDITGTRREIKALDRMIRGRIGDVALAVNDLLEKQLPSTQAKSSKPPNPHATEAPNYGKAYWSRENSPTPGTIIPAPGEMHRGPSSQPDAPPKGSLPPRQPAGNADLEQSKLYEQRDQEIQQGLSNALPASLPQHNVGTPVSPLQPNGMPDARLQSQIAAREAEIAKALAEAEKKREAGSVTPPKTQDTGQIEKKIGQLKDQIMAEQINRDSKAAMKAPPALLARIDHKIAQLESQVAELERGLDY